MERNLCEKCICEQKLHAAAQRQRASKICNRSAPHSNRSAFNYDPNIDHAKQSAVTIGAMSKICSKCTVKKMKQ